MITSVKFAAVFLSSPFFLSLSFTHCIPTVGAAEGSKRTPATGHVCVCVVRGQACILLACPFRSADISSSAQAAVLPSKRRRVYRVQFAQSAIDDLRDFIQPKAPNEELSLLTTSLYLYLSLSLCPLSTLLQHNRAV